MNVGTIFKIVWNIVWHIITAYDYPRVCSIKNVDLCTKRNELQDAINNFNSIILVCDSCITRMLKICYDPDLQVLFLSTLECAGS